MIISIFGILFSIVLFAIGCLGSWWISKYGLDDSDKHESIGVCMFFLIAYIGLSGFINALEDLLTWF